MDPPPYVVKPIDEGSSVGVHIVQEGDNALPLDDLPPGRPVLVEPYIPGRELTVSVMGDRALGVTELRPHSGFYDYTAKYTDGKTTHLCPAPVSEDVARRAMDYAVAAHRALGCRGVTRADFRYDDTAGEPETLFFDDFESGSFTAGGWTTSGGASVSTRADYNGIYGARLSSTSSIAKALSTVGYSEIHVTFYRRTQGLDSGEYLYCEWSDDGGQSWNPLGSTQSTSWYQEDFTCPSGANDNPDFQFRYRLNASSTREYAYIDDVEILGTP